MTILSRALDSLSARTAIVERHIRLENEHDLDGVLNTFGETAQYDDEPWDQHFEGRTGVRQFYEQLLKALPNLEIDIQRRHIAEDTILLKVILRGTHLGGWRGLPATFARIFLHKLFPSSSDNRKDASGGR
jgi:steroid delta-isomerase-like uncharacterized protein